MTPMCGRLPAAVPFRDTDEVTDHPRGKLLGEGTPVVELGATRECTNPEAIVAQYFAGQSVTGRHPHSNVAAITGRARDVLPDRRPGTSLPLAEFGHPLSPAHRAVRAVTVPTLVPLISTPSWDNTPVSGTLGDHR
ncbi:MAG: hypothetical protein M3443_11975 [Actinomycetota bacterium]|nr:hypothetical protein [Actinomycetota bacterium]